jgi:hypothetical protein
MNKFEIINIWNDYIELVQINSYGLACLINKMNDELIDFDIKYKTTVLEALKNDNLYGLKLKDVEIFERKCSNEYYNEFSCWQQYWNKVLCNNYLLPCFCVKENNKAIIIYTSKNHRNTGFAKKLLDLLQIDKN